MRLRLHRLNIALDSDDEPVRAAWTSLFAGWLQEDAPTVDARLRLTLQPSLPPPPTAAPIFDDACYWPDGVGVLRVYDAPGGALLYFVDAAQVAVSLPAPGDSAPNRSAGVVGPRAFSGGRFEDVTLTSLAPALRRHGYFLLHAFAAERDGRCVLLIGPTGSGKTTTGLNLVLHGWRMLANDAVLLEGRDDGVYALPTPGNLGIRPGTFELLPELASRLGLDDGTAVDVTGQVARDGAAVRVTALLFVELDGPASLAQVPTAVALAQVLAESVDRWDPNLLDSQVALLERLCRQAAPYTLRPGRDMARLAALIAAL